MEDIFIRLFLLQDRRTLSIQFLNVHCYPYIYMRKRLRRIGFTSHEIPVVGEF